MSNPFTRKRRLLEKKLDALATSLGLFWDNDSDYPDYNTSKYGFVGQFEDWKKEVAAKLKLKSGRSY